MKMDDFEGFLDEKDVPSAKTEASAPSTACKYAIITMSFVVVG